jgi:hypothetical protein
MKLSCVLVACNENTNYLDFWPAVKKAWWEICRLPCVMVYVGEVLPEHLKGDPAVKHFQPIKGWPTATQAQAIRLLYPALLKCDGAVMLSDMDMIPMQSEFFREGFSHFQPNQFVSLRGIDEREKQIYMCYVGATPQTWSDMFGVKTQEDITGILVQWSKEFISDGQHGGTGWCTDQQVLYDKVKGWQRDKPDRVGLIPWTKEIMRLDRGSPQEWYGWNGVLEAKILGKAYVDFHMPQYGYFKKQIDEVLNFTIKQLDHLG